MRKGSGSSKRILAAIVAAAMVVTSAPYPVMTAEAAENGTGQVVSAQTEEKTGDAEENAEGGVDEGQEANGENAGGSSGEENGDEAGGNAGQENGAPTGEDSGEQKDEEPGSSAEEGAQGEEDGTGKTGTDPVEATGEEEQGQQPGETAEEDPAAVSDNTTEAVSDNSMEQTALAAEDEKATGSLTVVGDTSKYSYNSEEDCVIIKDGAELTIHSAEGFNEDNCSSTWIRVEADASAVLTLDGVYIYEDELTTSNSPLKIEAEAGDVEIILKGTNKLSAGYGAAGIQKETGDSKLTISGDGTLTATGGYLGAGIGGGNEGAGSNITISGGTVTATGGGSAAGIGGGNEGAGSDITISGGTVTATGGDSAAGIGGGAAGFGTDITISGGTVTATGGDSAAGIGGGNGGNGSNIAISGGVVTASAGVFAAGIGGGSSGSGSRGVGSNITISGGTVRTLCPSEDNMCDEIGSGISAAAASGIVITGGSVSTQYTPLTKATDGTNPVYCTVVDLSEEYGKETAVDNVWETGYGMKDVQTDEDSRIYLYLPDSNGKQTKILFNKTYYAGVISKDNANNELVKQEKTPDYDLLVSGDPAFFERTAETDPDTKMEQALIVVKNGAELTFTSEKTRNESNPSKTAIRVEKDAKVKLTLDEVYINSAGFKNSCLQIADDSTGDVELILKGKNVFKTGSNCAGVQKNGDGNVGTLTISGDGELTANGGTYAAGIGGSRKGASTKNIVINSGTVNAAAGSFAAGIGGGQGGSGSYITINGGTVNVSGGAAGIGGGSGAAGTNIAINGGTIYAEGASGGAGIGGGNAGYGDTISIRAGKVTATGGYGAPGIGSGCEATQGGSIRISGGTVQAIGRNGNSGPSVGIGSGLSASTDGTKVTIVGGNVKTNGITNGAWSDDGTPVYLTRVDLLLLFGKRTAIDPFKMYQCDTDGSAVVGLTYNHDSIDTMDDGYLYLYLPANTEGQVTGIEFENTVYEGIVKQVSGEDATQYNELTLKSSADGKADYGDVDREDVLQGDIPDGLWIKVLNEDSYTYTGKPIKPQIRVYDGKRLLMEKKDYTLSYKNNVNAATADSGNKAPTITVTSKGNYKGKATKTFTIQPVALSIPGSWEDYKADQVDAPDIYLTAPTGKNPKGIKAVPVVSYNGVRLKENKDYTLEHYSLNEIIEDNNNKNNYVNEGQYYLYICGKGNYTGRFSIYVVLMNEKRLLMSKVSVAKIPDVTYEADQCIGSGAQGMRPTLTVTYGTGKNKTTLQENVDYTVTWENNKQVGTATAILEGMGSVWHGEDGQYYGEKRVTFKIKGAALKANMVSWEEARSITRTYNGEAQEPEVLVSTTRKVKDENGKTVNQQDILTKYDESTGKGDYTVTYLKNVDAGTATAVITGVNGYTGTVKKTFKITPVDLTDENTATAIRAAGADETSAQIKVSYAKNGAKPQIQVTANLETARQDATEAGTNTVTLEEGKDYTVSYANNKAVSEGKNLTVKKQPTITIKGKGNYKGSLRQTFVITAKSLADSESPLTITVADVAANKTKGKFVSKPVVTDADGGKLKEKTDYTLTYTLLNTDGTTEEKQLDPKTDAVDVTGSRIRVTITGAGNYAGENSVLTADYRVTERDFTKASFKIVTKSFSYTGKPVELTADDLKITFKTGSGKKAVTEELTLITDGDTTKDGYAIVGYQNNVNKGTAQITLKGCGKYGGTKTLKYTIGTKSFFWWVKPESEETK